MRPPEGLEAGGRGLWDAVTGQHDLDAPQLVQLEEACRAKDRADRMAAIVAAPSTPWRRVGEHALTIDDPQRQANHAADLLRQLIAALRLPDKHGRRPQRRGTPRGSYAARSVNRKRTS